MFHRSRPRIGLALVTLAALTYPATTGLAGSQDPAANADHDERHRVFGSGMIFEGEEVDHTAWEEGAFVRTTVVAVEKNDGSVWGTVALNGDLTENDLGQVSILAAVDCLLVRGNRAWIGAKVTFSTIPEFAPIGSNLQTFIIDRGTNGDGLDVQHSEIVADGIECTDRLRLEHSPVGTDDYNNFVIR